MIIGLVGNIGAGKGTVADIFTGQHNFEKESFANAVKDAIAPIFGWDRHMLEGDTLESREWRETPDPWWSAKIGKPFSPRHALQLMGTESGRNVFHSDLWVFSLLRRVSLADNYVIADVRFPNEIDLIREAGGRVFAVSRGPRPVWYDVALAYNQMTNWDGSMQKMDKYPDVHYSEWAWIGKSVDGSITNNGTVGELQELIDSIVQKMVQ